MKRFYLFMILMLVPVIVACSGSPLPVLDDLDLEPGFQVPLRDTFENKFDESQIPGQWPDYGVGDPYILRHDGIYYLYVSTKNFEVGVRAWQSENLIDWTQVDHPELPLGYVTVHPVSETAYAPEVHYVNGVFYMITSPAGQGHYILSADSPLGPFEPITGNIGESIDGTFFVDDDEQIYFLRSSRNGIRIVEVNDDFTFGAARTLDNTIIGSWTEGPYMIKREGIYYLTFTGNHVTSAGYRVAYATSVTDPFTRDAFTFGDNILLNTSEAFNGLGHSASVLGPDMDSLYIAYHNLNSSGGPNRSFNLGRLLFNGREMTINNPELTGNLVPVMPTFATRGTAELIEEQGFTLSQIEHEATFTAEFNVIGDDVTVVFDYVDANHYGYVHLKDDIITLGRMVAGEDTVLGTSELTKTYDIHALRTLRIAHRDGALDVFFNNMRRLADISYDAAQGGRIGYADTEHLEVGYTAFSNTAKGLSDQLEIKQSHVGAALHDPTDYQFSAGSGIQMVEHDGSDFFNGPIGAKKLVLDALGDHARYLVEVPESDFYGIEMVVPSAFGGRTIGLQINDGQRVRLNIPEVPTQEAYMRIRLTELDLPAGVHYFRFFHTGERTGFVSFNLFHASKETPVFDHALDDYVLRGSNYVNTWRLEEGGHLALSGNRQLLYFGDDRFTDVTMTVDIEFRGETTTSTAGVILRGGNAAFSVHDSHESIQGYYVGFNNSKIFISRYNYNLSRYEMVADAGNFVSGTAFEFEVSIVQNTIEVRVDGVLMLTHHDDLGFTHGRIGFYTDGAVAIYRNLRIR